MFCFAPPLECIASYLVREPGLQAEQCLEDYISFAQTTLQAVGQDNIHILIFEDVIRHPKSTATAILQRVGVNRALSDQMIEEATQDKRADKTRSSLPSPEKEALKQTHLNHIRSLPKYPQAVALFDQASVNKWPL